MTQKLFRLQSSIPQATDSFAILASFESNPWGNPGLIQQTKIVSRRNVLFHSSAPLRFLHLDSLARQKAGQSQKGKVWSCCKGRLRHIRSHTGLQLPIQCGSRNTGIYPRFSGCTGVFSSQLRVLIPYLCQLLPFRVAMRCLSPKAMCS